jgi:hypothetical protein
VSAFDPLGRSLPWEASGVTGLARAREWDVTAIADAPELAEPADRRVSFLAFPKDVLVPDAPGIAALAAALDAELERPYEAVAVPQEGGAWAVAGRRLRAELVELAGVEATSLELSAAPDGEVTAVVDGEPLLGEGEPAVAAALAELERQGRSRFEAFAARADKVSGERWMLVVDPL